MRVHPHPVVLYVLCECNPLAYYPVCAGAAFLAYYPVCAGAPPSTPPPLVLTVVQVPSIPVPTLCAGWPLCPLAGLHCVSTPGQRPVNTLSIVIADIFTVAAGMLRRLQECTFHRGRAHTSSVSAPASTVCVTPLSPYYALFTESSHNRRECTVLPDMLYGVYSVYSTVLFDLSAPIRLRPHRKYAKGDVK